MAEYTINEGLYAQAIEELKQNWGTDAKQIFFHSWNLATQNHENNAPKMTSLNLPPIRGMEDLRQKMIKEHADTFQIIKDIHREGLIGLFTMEKGISRSTAEQIVDKHVLIH